MLHHASSRSSFHQCHDEVVPVLFAFGFDELIVFFVFKGFDERLSYQLTN